jgi:hypothetical protein
MNRFIVLGRYGYIWKETRSLQEAFAKCHPRCGDTIVRMNVVGANPASAEAFRIAQEAR